MANSHFGNLADVFKHTVLAQVLESLRPSEYWESHAGSASYDESADIPLERRHGIHTFSRLAAEVPALSGSPYARAAGLAEPLTRIPGSSLLAARLLGANARRFLLCDLDADSLRTIQKGLAHAAARELAPESLECVQDDGISVLRGAGMILPETWRARTLAFIDPYDITAVSDAQITPLDLACELANGAVVTLLFYTFADEADRTRRQSSIREAVTKYRLGQRARQWEGSLKVPPAEAFSQWGFGLLALNLAAAKLDEVDARLHALEAAYGDVMMEAAGRSVTGAWSYRRLSGA